MRGKKRKQRNALLRLNPQVWFIFFISFPLLPLQVWNVSCLKRYLMIPVHLWSREVIVTKLRYCKGPFHKKKEKKKKSTLLIVHVCNWWTFKVPPAQLTIYTYIFILQDSGQEMGYILDRLPYNVVSMLFTKPPLIKESNGITDLTKNK